MKKLRLALLALAAAASCTTAVRAESGAAIGTSERAMSPNMTTQSYGARLEETALGCYVADGMRSGCGTDIAIECGGHLVRSLPGGTLTEEDTRAVFAGDLEVAVVELTADQLFDLLEYAVGELQIDEAERLDRESGSDRFPQVSGFSFEFDVSQLPGRRLRRVTLADGTELSRGDPRILTAALPMDMLDGTLGFSMLEGLDCRAAGTQSELLIRHIREEGQVTLPRTGRITMVGSEEDTLFESLNIGYFLPYILLLVVLFRLVWRKRRGKTDERKN